MGLSRSDTAACAGQPANEAERPAADSAQHVADLATGPQSSTPVRFRGFFRVALSRGFYRTALSRGFYRTAWSRRRRLVAGVAVLAVLATAVVVVQLMRGPGPDEVVREFLTAIQERDVDKALAIAGMDRPAGEQARFLDAKALSREWRIVAVETTSEHERDGSGSAQVDVTIAGPDGAEDGGFNLSKERGDERWRIDQPLLPVRLPGTPLWYVDVNGVIGPVFDGSYQMLPGFYRFYGTTSDLAEIKPMTALLLPLWNVARGGAFRPASVTLTAKGEQVVRDTVRSRIDACAKRTELALEGCPFGADPGGHIRTPDGSYLTGISNARWQILHHPVMALSDRGDGFRITFTTPGVVRLTATGRRLGAGDKPVPFTTYCPMGSRLRMDWYAAGLSTPDTLVIRQRDGAADTC